jgi:AcrR family transcriptional regulator
MSPRPQLDHIRKPQILGAAAEVIAERGVAATRIADIAERVGTSGPTVLYWFGSKDELLAAALNAQENRFYTLTRSRLDEIVHPRQQLRLLIDEATAGYDLTLWIELWTRALRDEAAEAARLRLDHRWRDEIARVIRDGVEAGEFAGHDPEGTALALACLLDGLGVQRTLGDPDVSVERMRDLALRTAELWLECEL